jgi:hypothetical protein
MKIEIDIDIESIVKEALKKKQEDEEETPKVWTEAVMKNSRSKWEYGRKNGRRRTPEEMALHDLEREKGRRLTPEEKGEAKAKVEIDITTENQVKEATIKKVRIDTMTAEGMAAASKELAEETKERDDNITRVQEGMDKHDIEAEIPKTKDLENLNSLFRD